MTATTVDEFDKEINQNISQRPGAQLAAVRMAKGYTLEEVAAKLHLRISLLQSLEADDYAKLPEVVFVKGYLRAYAKFLELNADPLIEIFNQNFAPENQADKIALWQLKKDTNNPERVIRWVTTIFGLIVLTSVAIWWEKSKDNQHFFATTTAEIKAENNNEQASVDIRLTDLSKMRSLLSADLQDNMQSTISPINNSENNYTKLENQGE